jgi:prepilin signal peptidase PulO-like enzyme (type II secretory pathway)
MVWKAVFMDWFSFLPLLSFLILAWRINRTTGLLPDWLTLTGTALGLVNSTAFPALVGGVTSVQGGGLSLLGAVVSFVHVLLLATLGKSILGPKCLEFSDPTLLRIKREDDFAFVELNGESTPLEALFTKMSDVAVARAHSVTVDNEGTVSEYANATLHIRYGFVEIEGLRHDMTTQTKIEAEIWTLKYPRDVIGFGVIKFMMVPGAFFGWKGALFVWWGAIILVALLYLMRRGFWLPVPPVICLEPYLIASAIAWMFVGMWS